MRALRKMRVIVTVYDLDEESRQVIWVMDSRFRLGALKGRNARSVGLRELCFFKLFFACFPQRFAAKNKNPKIFVET
jgi:hypothetical protein